MDPTELATKFPKSHGLAIDEESEATPDLEHPQYYIGRDPSWLAFNRRVLAQAQDGRAPLLERLKFLTICASNLDEFFMKRVPRLKRRQRTQLHAVAHDGMSVREQLEVSREAVLEICAAMGACLEEDLIPQLAAAGIGIASYADLPTATRKQVDAWFVDNVFPILTPLAVDPGHPFPFISNLSKNVGVLLERPGEEERHFARLKVPDVLPGLVAVPREGVVGGPQPPGDCRFLRLTEIVENNLDLVFPGMRIVAAMPFRITRSTGLEADEEPVEDILEHVEEALKQRRFAEAVRIEVFPDHSRAILDLLLEELELGDHDVYVRRGPLEYKDLFHLVELDRPDLSIRPWKPVTPPRLMVSEKDIFSILRERDLLVHHPYESFNASVERFIAEAAADPNVLAIKQTLYRTTSDSPFIANLVRAATEGKQVAVLVEVRARFDEHRNLQITRQLEKNGVHVAYGIVGLKTHSKCSLVVRREGTGLRSYAHLGTGNYHSGTAQLYTDIGLLTADPVVTSDVSGVFNYLTGGGQQREYETLIVAPLAMRQRFYELIDREAENARAGRPARIIAKMNQLEDTGIIQRLYAASQAGVKIRLFVRGFCCLRPGVPGVSENVRVLSTIGRFLEHSRIFHFAAGRADPLTGEWFIGSGDWMYRNIDTRVEVTVPVADRVARKRLSRALEVSLADRNDAWELGSDGSYRRLEPAESDAPDSPARLGTFETLCRDALESRRAARTVPQVRGGRPTEGATRARRRQPSSPEVEGHRALSILFDRPWLTQSELADAAGIPSGAIASIRRRLEELRLVRVHDVGGIAVWEALPAAVRSLGRKDRPLPGSLPYARRWIRARVEADLAGERTRVRRHVPHRSLHLDLLAEGPDGTRTVYQMMRRVSEGKLRALATAPCDRVVLACADADGVKLARHGIAKRARAGERRFEVVTLATLVRRTRSREAGRGR